MGISEFNNLDKSAFDQKTAPSCYFKLDGSSTYVQFIWIQNKLQINNCSKRFFFGRVCNATIWFTLKYSVASMKNKLDRYQMYSNKCCHLMKV